MKLRTIRERFHNCNGDEEVFKILTQGAGGKTSIGLWLFRLF